MIPATLSFSPQGRENLEVIAEKDFVFLDEVGSVFLTVWGRSLPPPLTFAVFGDILERGLGENQ